MNTHFTTVYQIAAEQYSSLSVFASAIRATAMIVTLAGFLFLSLLINKRVRSSKIGVVCIAFVGIALVVLGSTAARLRSQTNDALKAFQSGQYSVVEGPVTNFDPMPFEGHKLECFSVREERFCYSDYVVTPGFRNTASHGGPIRSGLLVRVGYRKTGIRNTILLLEVAK